MQLQRLNMDNSWLVDFAQTRLLIDPWLGGEQIDGARWFSVQRHLSPPLAPKELPPHDLVVITQSYSDHFHHETLLELAPEHVLAPKALLKPIKRLLPASKVTPLSAHTPSPFKALRFTLIPHDMTLGPNFHALVIDDGSESIVFAPHGLPKLKAMGAMPRCKLLMTTFNTYQLPRLLGGTIAPGTEQLERLVEVLEPEFVIRTHDEIKEAQGLVSRLAKVSNPSDEEALKLPYLSERFIPVDHYRPFTVEA